jgi:hypothetical protein
MIQTLTVWSNGAAEINTGTNVILYDGVLFTEALQTKLDAIESAISAAGISQLHAERDAFRQFEHAVAAGEVAANDFGTTVSVADFDWIMQHVDDETAAQEAAAEAESAESEESSA